MEFDDSDWTVAAEQPPAAPARRFSLGSLMAGVALGAIAASGVWWALEGPRGHTVAARATAQAASAAAASAARTADVAAPAITGSGVAMEGPAATTGMTARAGSASAADDERRARAWARYYQRPAACEGNPSTEQLVECANHFIRSKRQFDTDWAAGRL